VKRAQDVAAAGSEKQMTGWTLDETYETSAGTVAAGWTGEGPDLVLAHGWPWSSFSWHRVIPDLAADFRVHWYDMPGYGQSAKNADRRTSLDVQGRVFAEMLKHWGLSRTTSAAPRRCAPICCMAAISKSTCS
jgi:pimeloyl-ACP methyl ester carboxylesterase